MSKLSTSLTRKNIIVSERTNPLWERILASIFYLVSFLGFCLFGINTDFSEIGFVIGGLFIMLIYQGIFLTFAIKLSAVSAIHFDLDQNKYKKVYNIGFLQFGLWKALPFIEYLSIMYYTGTYEAHLKFLDEEEHIIFYADSYKEIFSLAYDTAKQINVGLFDSVIKNRQYWVDLNKDKTELLKEIGLVQESVVCIFPSDENYTKFKIQEVSEGQKALFFRILAALFFTLGVFYLFFLALYGYAIYKGSFKYLLQFVSAPIVDLLFYFSVPIFTLIWILKAKIAVEKVQFDKQHNIFRSISGYGWFKKKNQWKCIPETDYISIYYQATDNGYEISLFQTNKKAIEFFSGNNLGETFRLGYQVAKILDVELLNATNWDAQYWVDFNKTEEELFQELIRKNKK